MNEFIQTLQREGKNLQSELGSAFARCYAALAPGSRTDALLSGNGFVQGTTPAGRTDRILWKQDTVLEQEAASLAADFYGCIQLNPRVVSAIKKLDAGQADALQSLFEHDLATSQNTTVRDILRTISKGIAANDSLKSIVRQIHSTVQLRITAIEKMLASLCRQTNQIVLLCKYKQNGHSKYQYITERENCGTCHSLDGQVFEIAQAQTGENLPPMHPNCDCCVGVLDRDGKITALVGSGEKGFDLLHLPDNILRTPAGKLACAFEVLDDSAVDGVPFVLWDSKGGLDTGSDKEPGQRIMEISEAGLEFIASYEGYREMPYRGLDDGNRTVGYGHVIKPDDGTKYDNGLSQEKAWELFKKDMSEYAGYVSDFLIRNDLTLTQYQFDALVSFTYNTGYTWKGEIIALGRALLDGDFSAERITDAFMRWTKADTSQGSVYSSGLANRRKDEIELFLYGDYKRNY